MFYFTAIDFLQVKTSWWFLWLFLNNILFVFNYKIVYPLFNSLWWFIWLFILNYLLNFNYLLFCLFYCFSIFFFFFKIIFHVPVLLALSCNISTSINLIRSRIYLIIATTTNSHHSSSISFRLIINTLNCYFISYLIILSWFRFR